VIDVGANLLNAQFRKDLGQVIERASIAGVEHIMVTATSLDETEKAQALCAQHPNLSCTAGIHPHVAKDAESGWRERLLKLAQHRSVCAIGETGLDFNRNFSPPNRQRDLFREQIEVAGELGLPLFVHDRDTNGAVYETLAAFPGKPEKVLIHCFTGSRRDLHRYLDAGYSIGITGWVCDPFRGAELARLAPSIPLDRLLIETDAPFLFPHGATPPTGRRRRNEPCLLPAVAQQLADLYGLPIYELARHTTENARRLFGLGTAA